MAGRGVQGYVLFWPVELIVSESSNPGCYAYPATTSTCGLNFCALRVRPAPGRQLLGALRVPVLSNPSYGLITSGGFDVVGSQWPSESFLLLLLLPVPYLPWT